MEMTSCDTVPGRTVDDIVANAWSRILAVPAHQGDRLCDVLDPDYGLVASLQLRALLSEIGAGTGIHLPLTVALASPTAAGLAEMVWKRSWPRYERPVRLRDGVGTPLFVLPGLGGFGLGLVPLAEHLAFPGALYLNPPRGLDGAEPQTTLDAIVADHIATIRSVQPHGPYWFLGYSWGGLVALEMARVLAADNEKISFVGMIEPVLNELDWTYGAFWGFTKVRLQHHLTEIRKIRSVPSAIRYVSDRVVPLVGRVGRVFGFQQWDPLAGEAEKFPPPLDALYDAEVKAIDAHRLRPYAGEATLFATRSGHALLCDPVKVWSGKLGNLDLQWLAGDHTSVLIPSMVKATAGVISASLTARLP